MKLYAIVLLTALVSYCEAQKCTPAALGVVVKKCLTETKSSEVDLLHLLAVKKARSDNAKCFRACLMKKCDYMDDKGNIPMVFSKDTGVLLGAGDAEKSKRIEVACENCLSTIKHKDNLCDYTADLFNCVIDSCQTCGIVVPISKL